MSVYITNKNLTVGLNSKASLDTVNLQTVKNASDQIWSKTTATGIGTLGNSSIFTVLGIGSLVSIYGNNSDTGLTTTLTVQFGFNKSTFYNTTNTITVTNGSDFQLTFSCASKYIRVQSSANTNIDCFYGVSA